MVDARFSNVFILFVLRTTESDQGMFCFFFPSLAFRSYKYLLELTDGQIDRQAHIYGRTDVESDRQTLKQTD